MVEEPRKKSISCFLNACLLPRGEWAPGSPQGPIVERLNRESFARVPAREGGVGYSSYID